MVCYWLKDILIKKKVFSLLIYVANATKISTDAGISNSNITEVFSRVSWGQKDGRVIRGMNRNMTNVLRRHLKWLVIIRHILHIKTNICEIRIECGTVVAVIVWIYNYLYLWSYMQITTDVVSSILDQGEVYNIMW